MATKEEVEKALQSFPEFTVYVCYRGDKPSYSTGERYALLGKDYNACTEALKKAKEGEFKERQDEDLFNVVREKELRDKEDVDTGLNSLINRLREISYEIDDILNDYEGE